MNRQKAIVIDRNAPVLIHGTEIKETVTRIDDEDVATIFGQSENGNFRAVGSVRAIPFGADRPSPMIVIECKVEIWSNKELTRFLLAINDKAKYYGFVGFGFRKSARAEL